MDELKAGLSASLLIRDPETKRLFVNFDNSISELIQEAKYMRAMNLDVPEVADRLVYREQQIKADRLA